MKRNRNAHSEKLSTHFDPVRCTSSGCTIFTVHLFDKSLRYTSFYFFSRHYNVRYGHKLLKGTLQSSLKILTWHMTKHNKNQSIQSSSFNLTWSIQSSRIYLVVSNMTSLVEQSDAQSIEYIFLLKSLIKSNDFLIGILFKQVWVEKSKVQV